MDIIRLQKAIADLDEMLAYLENKKYAYNDDGIGLYMYPDGGCEIQPIAWHSKDFESIDEFVEYMENKSWIEEFE